MTTASENITSLIWPCCEVFIMMLEHQFQIQPCLAPSRLTVIPSWFDLQWCAAW